MGARQLSAASQLQKLLAWLTAAAAVQSCVAGTFSYAAELAATGGACSPGDAAGLSRLRDLNASQLAQGALNTSNLSIWDFGSGSQALKAPAGTAVSLSCVTALNATVAAPSAAAGSVFLQPTALDLSAASGLSMAGVNLSTDCGTVLAYQQYLCTSLRAAGSLEVDPGVIRFSRWRDGFTALDNVTLTCPTSAGAAAAAVPCRLVSVQTAAELLEAFTVHAPGAALARANLTIVLAANISINTSVWPASPPVVVDANVTLVGSPLRVPRVIFELGQLTGIWNLTRDANVEIHNLTLVQLAPAYPNPPGYGLFTSRINAFIRTGKQVFLRNVTCVVPPEEVSYLRYWITYLVSPVPEAHAKADWLLIPQVSIAAVNSSGVYYAYQNGRTTIFDNMAMVDSLGPGYPLHPSPSGLGQLQANSVPLTAINAATNAQDVQLALFPNRTTPDEKGRRWVLLVDNISLAAAGQWPQGPAGNTTSSSDARVGLQGTALDVGSSCGGGSCEAAAAPAGNDTNEMGAGVQVPGLMVFASLIPERPVRLGLGWRLSALGVPGGGGAGLMVRNLVLSELAARGSSYSRGDPLAVLSSPLWGVSLAAGASKTRLENCTLVVSAEELRLLQQALLPAEQLAAVRVAGAGAGYTGGHATANSTGGSGSPQRPFDSALAAATRSFFTVGGDVRLGTPTARRLVFVTGSAARFTMSNVTFRVPDPGSGEQANAGLTALGVPYEDGRSGASASGGGAPVGAIVGGVVGGCVLLLLVGGAAWLTARNKMRAKSHEKERYDVDLEQLGAAATAAAGARSRASGGEGISGAGAGRASRSGSSEAQRRRQLQSSLTGSSPMLPSAGGGRNSVEAETARAKGAMKDDVGPSFSAATRSGSGTQSVPVSGPSGTGLPAGLTAGAVQVGNQAAWGAGAPGIQALLAGESGAAQPGARCATMTDSFNRPPTLTMSGLLAQRPGQPSGSGAQPAQHGGGSSGAPTAAASSTQSGSKPDTGSHSRGAALEQMRGVIATLGRDLADDQQLVVHGHIGQGAHGTVYRGSWRGLPVAVKSMVFGPDDHARHQQRPLMEAAISSNLVHPNIVTTYSYELREVQHELASLSPELSQQGGGWRLLIIQEFCDAGPLRRLVDCGYFLTPPRPATPSAATARPASARSRPSLPSVPALWRGAAQAGAPASPAPMTPAAGPRRRAIDSDSLAESAALPRSRESGSSTSRQDLAESRRATPDDDKGTGGHGLVAEIGLEAARVDRDQGGRRTSATAGAAPDNPHTRPLLEDVPADVSGGRPASSLQAALRYVEAALQIARGLQHIHDKNIVHGDLNPNNVLLVRAPGMPLGFCLKVSDFGLSVHVGDSRSHLSNLFQGTPYYCAPEVMLSGKVGKSADLYSLGIMLWELQNGTRPPWRMGVRLRTYPSLNTGELEFGPDTPPRYARLARECFHASGAVRPSVGAVVAALERIREELEAQARMAEAIGAV